MGSVFAVSVSTSHGVAVTGFPDVCKTPSPGGPVPIPYPSVGMQSNVSVAKRDGTGKIVVQSSTIKSGGTKAVVSSKSGGSTSFPMASMDVKVEGKNVARMGSPLVNNSSKVNLLRSRLQSINSQLISMSAGNPNQWHQLVDEYVVVSAELYLELLK